MSNDNLKDKPLSQEQRVDEGNDHMLVLYNDDINTFDHVIKALVEICGHDSIQAEQCAVLTHFRGSCEVKTGSFPILNAMCGALVERDLSSEIKS